MINMSLVEKIKENIAAALKGGEKERAGVLRLLLSELNNKQKEKFGGNPKPLTDEDALAVLKKEVKKRKEAIELFRKGNREDLAKKDEAELKIIGEYLPPEISSQEIKAVVERLFAAGNKEFNTLMRETMKELAGQADGKVVSGIVKEVLAK